MAEEPQAGEQPKKESWPVLDAHERRVLGVLAEKSKTTPDAYPLSLNALTTGCNQKSNREPVMGLTDVDVEDTLGRLQKRGLVVRRTSTSSRVDRWGHQLYDAWRLDRTDLAILAELLLRGPQTEGELRTRAARMEPFDDLDALRAALKPLLERGLVVYLTVPGRRATVVSHGFHAPDELARLRQRHGEAEESAEPARESAAPGPWEQRLDEARSEIARLAGEVEGLKTTVAELTRVVEALAVQVREVRQGLGM